MSPTRKKRSPKIYIAEHLRRVLGENVRTYMAARYARERTLTDQMRAPRSWTARPRTPADTPCGP
jgi:hypothetical protein